MAGAVIAIIISVGWCWFWSWAGLEFCGYTWWIYVIPVVGVLVKGVFGVDMRGDSANQEVMRIGTEKGYNSPEYRQAKIQAEQTRILKDIRDKNDQYN